MGSYNSKSVSTYSFSFPSYVFSIYGIDDSDDERQLFDGLSIIFTMRNEILDRVVEQRIPKFKKSRMDEKLKAIRSLGSSSWLSLITYILIPFRR